VSYTLCMESPYFFTLTR